MLLQCIVDSLKLHFRAYTILTVKKIGKLPWSIVNIITNLDNETLYFASGWTKQKSKLFEFIRTRNQLRVRELATSCSVNGCLPLFIQISCLILFIHSLALLQTTSRIYLYLSCAEIVDIELFKKILQGSDHFCFNRNYESICRRFQVIESH